jgi:hypothetical protein
MMMSRIVRNLGLLAGVATLSTWASAQQETKRPADKAMQQQQAQGARTISAEELVKNPERYYGQQITVKAKVDDVTSPHAFTLDEDAAFAGPDVLVLVPGTAASVPDDKKVTVTGKVRRYVTAELDKDYDWFDASPDWETKFKERPVIVADSVKSEDGRELTKRGSNK